MVDTGTALIVGSIISLAGAIIIMTMNNNNWFKRENFKIQKSNMMATNKLNLKKLERELGIQEGTTKLQPTETNLIDQLKGLDVDKVKGILGMVQKEEEEEDYEEDERNVLERALGQIVDDPAMQKKALDLIRGVTDGKKGEDVPPVR